MKILKKIVALCLVFCLGLGLGCLSEYPFTENSRFEAFTEKLFRSEVSGNALSLHYTLADPASRGISTQNISLGTVNTDFKETAALCAEYEKKLKGFAYSKLSRDNQLTLDMLLLYFHTRSTLGENYLLDEPLGASLGIQAQLPVLLAEYAFYTEKDISDYLKLLGTIKPYFQSILEFEKKKSQAGLFMSDTSLDRILTQCQAFIQDTDANYIDEIFAQKLQTLGSLKDEDQTILCTWHHKLILEQVIPAYQNLMAGLEKLRGTGQTSRGLAYFPGGREYYLYLLRTQTGSYVPVKQIEQRLSTQLMNDYEQIRSLIRTDSSLISSLSRYTDTITLTPAQMLEKLPALMAKDFPALNNVSYEIRYVHPSMKKFLSPAFYLTPPIDTQTPNVIYINQSDRTSRLELFGTLAHEGFPGHLYQTVSFARSTPSSIRYLITSPGYIEGWATYVESYAYQYAASLMPDAGSETASAAVTLAWLNRSMNLCIYSLIDLGIHYSGWDQARTAAFLKAFGITNTSTVSEIFQYIVETPGNYLKYYLGYLNFLDLKNKCSQKSSDNFDLKDFHRQILEIGPVQFPVLEKYMN
ncbi:DUF885 domain-containing protein [Ruminococcus sp. AF21-42]|nr:DUF885 domain-containing protein [Ruminococcus sp. AF21-42]